MSAATEISIGQKVKISGKESVFKYWTGTVSQK